MRARIALAGLLVALTAPEVWGAPFVYVFNSAGGFLKLDRAGGGIRAAWALAGVKGMGPLVPAGRPDGPVVESLAFDSGRQILYLVLPETSEADAQGRKRHRVVAAALPDFAVLGTFRVPGLVARSPEILLGSGGDKLYIQWRDAAAEAARPALGSPIYVLSAPALGGLLRMQAVSPRTAAPDPEALPLLTPQSYFAPDGQVIFDRNLLIRLTGGTYTAERFRPQLDEEQQARARRYALDPPDSPSRYEVLPVDSEAGKVLVKVTSHRPEVRGDLLFVADPLAGAHGPLFDVPRARARLLPDGRRVVVQEADGDLERASSQIRATGRVSIFDGTTGQRLAAVEDPRLAGPWETVGFLCAPADGGEIYFRGAGDRLVALEPVAGRVRVPEADFPVDAGTRCVFATQ